MTTSFEVGARTGMEKVAGPWDWIKAQAGKRRDVNMGTVDTISNANAPNFIGKMFMSRGNQDRAAKAVSGVAQQVMSEAASPAAAKGMSELASHMSASAVKSVMTPANKQWMSDAASNALDQTLTRNRQLITDVANEAVSKSLSPENASRLIGQTLTRAWKPLAVAGMGAGVMLGAGAGIGIALGNMAVNRGKKIKENMPMFGGGG